jgi:hypothetical protein
MIFGKYVWTPAMDGVDVRRFVEAWNHRSAWAFPIHHILKNMRAFAVNPRCQDAARF